MPTTEKAQMISELEAKMGRCKSAVLADFRGLNVGQITKLRKRLREAGIEYKVTKNTLIRIAAEQAGVRGLETYLEGPTAIAFSYDDPVVPAKILSEFAKETKILQIKGGFLNNAAISKSDVMALADLPSREVLIAKLAGTLKSPISGLANVLAGPMRKLVWALDAIKSQKEGSAS